jgi:hypothetical protein
MWVGDGLTAFYPWLIFIAALRSLNIIIAALKYHTFAILHTWGNKGTGLVLFITPLLYVLFSRLEVFYPVCIIALLTAGEETVILITAPTLDVNRRSVFKI